MLEVGRNSYVSLEEADTYASSSPLGQRWSSLDPGQREQLLVAACEGLERQAYPGKSLEDQALTFPRLPNTSVPREVKAAQVEQALYLMDPGTRAEWVQRQELQAQGVASFSLGDLSESYQGGYSGPGELCLEARLRLKRYLGGGVGMC